MENLTEYVQDFYAENYKILVKGAEESLNQWRDILRFWIERLDLVMIIDFLQIDLYDYFQFLSKSQQFFVT